MGELMMSIKKNVSYLNLQGSKINTQHIVQITALRCIFFKFKYAFFTPINTHSTFPIGTAYKMGTKFQIIQ